MSISKLPNNILINDKVKSVYNFNEFSLQDLLSKFFEKINETIDVSNKALDFLNYLKNEGLPKEVIKELELMYQDGRLTELINNLANDVTGKVNEVTNKFNQLQVDVAKNITDFKVEVNQSFNNFETNVLPNFEVDGGVW